MVRRQEKTDDGLQEIKMVALISVDFAINMVRQQACLLFHLFSGRLLGATGLRQMLRMGAEGRTPQYTSILREK